MVRGRLTGSSNNAVLSTAWASALVLRIPGDSITAIVIGVLYLKGLDLRPLIFVKTPELVYPIFISFQLTNLFLIPLGWAIIRASRYLFPVPQAYFLPAFWPPVSLAVSQSTTPPSGPG